jgi:hypothetical protein
MLLHKLAVADMTQAAVLLLSAGSSIAARLRPKKCVIVYQATLVLTASQTVAAGR